MNWVKVVLMVWLFVGAMTTVSQVGKPRQPLTPGVAAISLVFTATLIALVVIA